MFSYLAFLQAEFPFVVYFVTLWFGMIIGSFLNVVTYRLPIMLERDWSDQANEILGNELEKESNLKRETFNLILPNSKCPNCQHSIRPWENIPFFSYLFLKGRCSNCQQVISARYPIVEISTGLLTVMVIYTFGVTPASLFLCVLTWALIALALIDFDTQLLPDDITLPLLWLGLIVNYFSLITDFRDAFIGACMGYLVFWIVFQVFKLVTGKEGMGYGDFKLLAMLGAWLGWQYLPLIIILSSFSGAIVGGSLIALGRDKSRPIPFGPYLAIAGWITVIWGEEILHSYLQFTAIGTT